MAVWLFRGGEQGKYEAVALAENCVVFEAKGIGELHAGESRAELRRRIAERVPNKSNSTIGGWVTETSNFRDIIDIGDLVIMPRGKVIAIGRITSRCYRPDAQLVRDED